jgi:hypothetical protein
MIYYVCYLTLSYKPVGVINYDTNCCVLGLQNIDLSKSWLSYIN